MLRNRFTTAGFLFAWLSATAALLVLAGWAGWLGARAAGVATRRDVEQAGTAVREKVCALLAAGNGAAVRRECQAVVQGTVLRLIVTGLEGEAVADTAGQFGPGEDLREMPGVTDALGGHETTGAHTAAARPGRPEECVLVETLQCDSRVVGAMQVSAPSMLGNWPLRAALNRLVWLTLGLVGMLGFAFALGARRLRLELDEVGAVMDRLRQGDLEHALPSRPLPGLDGVVEAAVHLARETDLRARQLLERLSRLEAVLAGMREGVLSLDRDEGVLICNRAAGEMLGVDPAAAAGRGLQEVFRNADLLRLAKRVRETGEPAGAEIALEGDQRRHLEVHGTALLDADGHDSGMLVVLTDVTRLRHLEQVRRDFVANVSHELRTPVTAIQGFVQTLRDEDATGSADERRRFLDILTRQAERLGAIIEDLLTLSKLDQQSERATIRLENAPVWRVLAGAVENYAAEVTRKGIVLTIDCPEDLMAQANPPLLEHAVANLVENAVRYSDTGGSVRVEAAEEHGEIVVRVRDTGCGIAAEHLPRLFERFYRVDKARSRKEGGTGLGLAIVNHIAQVHGGRVSVESVPGRGSTFTMRLLAAGRQGGRS